MQECSILVVEGAMVFEDLVILIVHPLWVWSTTSGKNGKFDAFRNVGNIVFGEDRICRGNLKSLKVWFFAHFLVADAVDPNSFDPYADGLLSSWCRFGFVREKVVGHMSEVVHVKVSASSRIDA